MPILRIVLTLLIVLGSLTAKCQTFLLNGADYIGKTQKEINKINETNNNKLVHKENVETIISIIYDDSLNSMAHHFCFMRKFPFGRRLCFSYLVNVNGDQSQFEKTKSDLLTKCEEISYQQAIQVSGTKKYEWLYFSSSDSKHYTFAVENHYPKRKKK